MSETKPHEFICPRCETLLRVAGELAGFTAPCPSCETLITAPELPELTEKEAKEEAEPAEAEPSSPAQQSKGAKESLAPLVESPSHSAPSQPREDPPKKGGFGIIFLASFLLLAAALIYWVFGIMKNSEPPAEVVKDEAVHVTEEVPLSTPLIPISEVSPVGPEIEVEEERTPIDPVEPEIPAEAELPEAMPPPRPEEPKPLQHEAQDLKKAGEVSGDLPELG